MKGSKGIWEAHHFSPPGVRTSVRVQQGRTSRLPYRTVIPAKAGIQCLCTFRHQRHWIPAFAGMTNKTPTLELDAPPAPA
ncbi:hypothetical protein HY57_10250 [Dyella japonica A8]|uniref:Uncharacterized protein n=1 Tax=Dyella japonica A8 TaxID=1217721 RepID=A0A075K615_9GAMM|nr:hypothetical protein HY57_10250 [Dyella japonica A8]